MLKKYNDVPLSVLDFVEHTESMTKGELLTFANDLGTKLKSETIVKGHPLYPIGYEIDHLIHFIKQVMWGLQTSVEPVCLRDYDVTLYNRIKSRYH